MFEDYTAEALLEDVLSKAPDGIDTRAGSIFYDAISGIVEQIAKMYTDLDQVFNYVFISTTSGEYLDMKASEYGMTRNAATAAKYYLVYEGTAPDTGARFFHGDTGLYFTVAEVETDDGTVHILVAEETGTSGNNIAEGDLAVPVNTITGLTSSTFGAVYEYGTDDEDDDSLRTRIQEKIAGPAENGNKQHYKTWCESIDGVGLARITPLWNGPNTVKGVLISPLGLPCSDSIVAEVQEYIDPATLGQTTEVDGKTYVVGDGLGEGVANLGAHFTAVAADSIGITVEFTAILSSEGSTTSAAEEVTEALTEYFKELVMETETASDITVRLTSVGAIIAGVDSVLDYSDLTLNGGTDNISPGDDGVPVVSEVIVNVES
ncbi:MAG: baseplate J/gp47 family protein [Oscillospiraceae bacterium]|nr:baseplate J/gp47 family protein [Oscillospiraceae bacterium]